MQRRRRSRQGQCVAADQLQHCTKERKREREPRSALVNCVEPSSVHRVVVRLHKQTHETESLGKVSEWVKEKSKKIDRGSNRNQKKRQKVHQKQKILLTAAAAAAAGNFKPVKRVQSFSPNLFFFFFFSGHNKIDQEQQKGRRQEYAAAGAPQVQWRCCFRVKI